MCVAPTRAQAEDIASAVTLEFEELPAVTDMLAALPSPARRWCMRSGATTFSSSSGENGAGSTTSPRPRPIKVSKNPSAPRATACSRWKDAA